MTRWRGLVDPAEGSHVLVLFHDCQLVSGDMLWSPDDDSDHIAFQKLAEDVLMPMALGGDEA